METIFTAVSSFIVGFFTTVYFYTKIKNKNQPSTGRDMFISWCVAIVVVIAYAVLLNAIRR